MPVTVETAAFCKTCVNQLLAIALPRETEKLVQQYNELHKTADRLATNFLSTNSELSSLKAQIWWWAQSQKLPPMIN